MKNYYLLFILLIYSLSGSSQNLSDYQKLRGEVISSSPKDEYRTHAYNAFDGNKATYFEASTSGSWIGLDLKGAYKIEKVRIFVRSGKTTQMNGCIIQGADNRDFNNPIELFTTETRPDAEQYTVYDIANDEPVRYVRCYVPDNVCDLKELEFYASEDSQPLDYVQLTSLPTIYLETKGNFDFIDKSNWAKNSNVVVVDESGVNTYLAEIRGRGNSTWGLDKKPFRIKFDKKQNFMGLPAKAKNWTLIASHVDKTLLRNGLTFDLGRFLEFEFSPSCVYVDVVLDGFYYGSFFVSDHIEVNENRVNVTEMSPGDISEPEITGGYHLEIDGYADQEPVYFRTPRGVPITIKSPKDDEIIDEQKEWIENHVKKLEQMLYEDPERACEQYIDVSSAVKYYLLSEIVGNCDAFWSIHLYKKRDDNKIYFGPPWDFDQAYLNDGRVRLEQPIMSVDFGFKQWYNIIMETEAAREELKKLWAKSVEEDLLQRMLDYVDDNAALLSQSQALNYDRWKSLDQPIFTNIVTFGTYSEYIDYVKDYLVKRFDWYKIYYNEMVADKHTVLPTSEQADNRQIWKYTLNQESGWHKISFDDSAWASGLAPFGNGGATSWIGENTIYIRQKFNVDRNVLNSIDKLFLRIFYDEDCFVYVNGSPVLIKTGYLTYYQNFEIRNDCLREGENTIAISCKNTGGGQMIDAGIYAFFDESANVITESWEKDFNYSINDNKLIIDNVSLNSTVSIYTVDGRMIESFISYQEQTSIFLPQKGVYIVRINDRGFKVLY